MSETRASDGSEPVKWGDPTLAAFALPEENVASRDDWFTWLAARKDMHSDVNRLLDNQDDDAQNQIPPPRPTNDESLDPSLAAVNALVDPVSHPDDAPEAKPHQAAPPTDNSPPPNLAGAGQGPGGVSTPFAPGGGSSSGGGGGGNGNQLAQLGNLGLFSPHSTAGPSSGAMPAALTPMHPLSTGPDSSPSTLSGIRPLLLGSPVANNDNYTLLHDSTLSVPASAGVLANDTDPNQLPLSAVLVSTTTHGSLTLNSDGSFAYTANAGYTGSDSFQYYATDGQANSNTATVTFTVNDPNAPGAVADSYSGLHDQVLSVDAGAGVLANDSDADGDTLTAALVSGSGPAHGTLQFNSDGSFTYTPNAGYVGTDSFQYTASDGVLSSAATMVSLTLTDNAPVAAAHSYGIPENTTENVTAASGLLAGASDTDGDPLTASLVGNANHGNVTVNSDGSFVYTPTTGYSGSDSFQYEASDGAESSTATVSLTVHATDSAPTANAAAYTVLHDQVLTETAAQGVLSHASDADNDPLTASLVNGSGPMHGTLTFNNDGSFTYTPNAGYSGSDSFQYQVSDGQQTSSAATVTLTINDPNAPVANADSYSVERNNEFDADASTGVLANDTDADGDTLTAQAVSEPQHGMLTLNSDGSFSYVPSSNYTGTDSFTYTASDGVQSSAAATVTLTISGGAPVANNDTYQTLENQQLFLDGPAVLGNDDSPDNMPLQSIQLTQPSHGTATLTTSGSISYTPNSNYVGTDSFTYDDSDGSLTSNTATITINVKASNTAPTASNLSYTLAHDSSLSTDSSSGLLSGASDSDGDTLFPVLMSMPTRGSLQFTPYGDGSFTYTPDPGFSGTDSFTYQVSDGIATSNTATVTLTVTNDAPTANPDSYSVLASGPTSVSAAEGVLANDTDGEGDTLTAVQVSQPAHGSMMLNSDGSFTYMPGSGFTGSDSFTYKAYDGVNYSSPVTVTLTSGPVAVDQEYGVTHDQTLSVDATDGLLTGAVDADGDPLMAALATGASHGTVTVNSDGSFTYTPATHYVGTDTFTFTVSDGTNTSAPATATINVTDDVPTAGPQTWDTPENTALTVNAANGVLASSSDDDGDSLTAQLVSGPTNGALALSSGGNFTYTPNTGFFGTDSFTYDVTDGISTSAPATVTITVDQVISENMPSSVYSAVTTADFNNEGNPDVAVADQGLNTVSVLLDNSSGVVSTVPVSTTTVGTAPVGLAAADFNNDGKMDLAVANSGSNSVSILLGNGDGTFTAGTTLTNFNDPVAVVAGNFGNGQQDLAVVNKGSNGVSILLGNGNGTFTPGTPLTTGSSPTSIAAADFNNVSKLDLVVTNSASNTVSVFLGNGGGTFAAALTDAVGMAPMSVTTGDFNGDGNVDLAVANSGSNNVSVLLGNGDGTFQAAANYAVGSDPVAIAAGDFDGNGFINLSVANKGDNTITNLSNSGDGTYFFVADTSSAVSDPVAIATADFNHDGLTDQAIAMADPKLEIKKGDYDANANQVPLGPVAVSSQGVIAAAMQTASKRENLLRFWNGKTGKPMYTEVANFPVTALAFSPDGNTLAVASSKNSLVVGGSNVVLWDVKGKKMAAVQPKMPREERPPDSVAFSPDGKWLAAGTINGTVDLWNMNDLTDLQDLKTVSKDGQPVTQVMFSKQNILAALTSDVVDFYDVSKKGSPFVGQPRGSGPFVAMGFSPSGAWFVLARNQDKGSFVSVSTTTNGVPSGTLASYKTGSPVLSVAFINEQKFIVVENGKFTYVTIAGKKLTPGTPYTPGEGYRYEEVAIGSFAGPNGNRPYAASSKAKGGVPGSGGVVEVDDASTTENVWTLK